MVNLTKPPPKKLPSHSGMAVRFGEVRTQSELNPDVALRILRQHVGALQRCYPSPPTQGAGGRQTFEIHIELDECGLVLLAQVVDGAPKDSTLHSCLVQAMKPLAFPRPARLPATLSVSLSFSR
jgi:hypothetical protein